MAELIETPRIWIERTVGPKAAEGVPADMTWNGFYAACFRKDGQPPLPDRNVQEKCLWRLAEILHTPIETLITQIEKERNR